MKENLLCKLFAMHLLCNDFCIICRSYFASESGIKYLEVRTASLNCSVLASVHCIYFSCFKCRLLRCAVCV